MSDRRTRLLYYLTFVILCVGLLMAGGMIAQLNDQMAVMESNEALLFDYIDQQNKAYEELVVQYETASETINFWHQEYQDAEDRCTELRANPIIKEVPIEIIKEVEKIVEVEKPIYQPPRFFESTAEAQAWIDENHLPIKFIGKMDLENYTPDSRYDCDDYSEDYQALAFESMLIVTECPVTDGKIWGVRVTDILENHVGCWTKINNAYFYVETSPGGEARWQLVKISDAD